MFEKFVNQMKFEKNTKFSFARFLSYAYSSNLSNITYLNNVFNFTSLLIINLPVSYIFIDS